MALVVGIAYFLDPFIELVIEGNFEPFDRQHSTKGVVFALGMIALITGFKLYSRSRAKSRRAIEESEERFRNLIEGSLQGILVHRDFKLLFVNQALAEMYGYDSTEELLAMGDVRQLIAPHEHERMSGYYQGRMAGADPVSNYEFEGLRKDGTLIWLDSQNRKVNWSGDAAIQATLIDITERKKAEFAMREAKESAEAATKLKDQFVSLVAHDLRSPFASIIGYMELMRDDDRHPLDEHQREVLGRVLDKGESLVKMIDELLNISRLQTGQLVPKFQFVDAQLVISLACSKINQFAADKGIDIFKDVPQGIRIYTDVNLLGEVFQNLLTNAIKFSLANGTIRIFVPPDQPHTIAVADLGMGIDEALLPDVFRHEVKTTTTGTAGEAGTGLGLPFCKDIMAALEGDLRLETIPGEGTTFYVQLPSTRPQILIADDEQGDREKLRQHLRDLEVDVVEADNGESAVRIIAETPPHLIITDIGMPKLDGFGVLEAVKANLATKSIPILLISADTETATRDKAFRLGADDFLNKPIEPNEFIPRVRRFLE